MGKVDWRLYSNDELSLEDINADAIFTDDFIIYTDDYGKHTIDRNTRFYERIDKESTMSIFFNKKVMLLQFDNQQYTFDIDCSYEDKDNEITLNYDLGDEKKVIKITGKEEI